MRKKIVIALGGNALGKTPEEQLELVKQTAKYNMEQHYYEYDLHQILDELTKYCLVVTYSYCKSLKGVKNEEENCRYN